jgi:hypothetical protein
MFRPLKVPTSGEKGFKSGLSVDSHEATERTTKSVPPVVTDSHVNETKTKQLLKKTVQADPYLPPPFWGFYRL